MQFENGLTRLSKKLKICSCEHNSGGRNIALFIQRLEFEPQILHLFI